MRRIALIVGTLASLFISAQATTYYIAPAGSDSHTGRSISSPWQTFDHAWTQMYCGDSLILMDGTYTRGTNTQPYILEWNCTAGAPLTVKAQHERQAHIIDDGCVTNFIINKSSYIIVDGLRVSSQDNPSCTSPNALLLAVDSDHLTVKNMLYHAVNFSANFPGQQFNNVSYSLTEDCEIYGFHRHAFGNANSDHNVFRRIYCNDRGSPSSNTGDGAVTWYPGSYNIAENVINEGDAYVTDIQALGMSQENKVLGCIGIGGPIGAFGSYRCRSHDVPAYPEPTNMPVNNLIQDAVYIGQSNSAGFGMTMRGNRNTQIKHASFFTPGLSYGFSADVEAPMPCEPPYSVFIENSFVTASNTYRAFVLSNQTSWSLTNTDAIGANIANYEPAPPSSNHVSVLSVDPGMGACRAWVPQGSPMKGAGKNGEDIGANILYRYKDGVLTTEPLWDPATGAFPCGATVAGINDGANSCINVHQRLNVNCNGCPFPAGYPTSSGIVGSRTLDVGRQAAVMLRPVDSGISIQWSGPKEAHATVYSLDGRKLASFGNIGKNGIVWNPGKSSVGVYLVRVESENITRTAKVFCWR